MRFEELVEQHRIHRFVANGLASFCPYRELYRGCKRLAVLTMITLELGPVLVPL